MCDLSVLIQANDLTCMEMESVPANQKFFMKPVESCIMLDIASVSSDIIVNNMPMICIYCLLYRKCFTH